MTLAARMIAEPSAAPMAGGAFRGDAILGDPDRYARCIAASKRVRWDIDRDVIRGRRFDASEKYLPDGISRIDRMAFLSHGEKRLLSQIQGRTYANMFGLLERFINAKMLDISRDYWFEDQTALEALVRFSAEELKHQELFRRIERMIAAKLPPGYRFVPQPNAVARVVLGKSRWAVLALSLHVELLTQMHYRQSIEPDEDLSPLFRDVFLFHWREESQHAILDELELKRHDATLSRSDRDTAVDDFIALIEAVDGILRDQASEDLRYFTEICGRLMNRAARRELGSAILGSYRRQYLFTGAGHPQFLEVIGDLTTGAQARRIGKTLATLS